MASGLRNRCSTTELRWHEIHMPDNDNSEQWLKSNNKLRAFSRNRKQKRRGSRFFATLRMTVAKDLE